MNISLAVTAALHGATTLNHIEVVRLTKDGEDKIDGVFVRDRIGPSDAPFQVSAKCVINATGALCDTIRMMDDQSVRELVRPSSGVHVTLPEYCTPPDMGLIDPSSPDGRVVFVLPWQGRTIAGTTDKPCEAEHDPIPAEEDIQWILERVSSYLRPDVSLKRTDVLSAWSGIRPLIQDPAATTSEQLVRNHYLTISPSGLITIAGGKWTTFREMAEKTVDFAIEQCVLGRAGACQTADLKLIGAHRWSPTLFIRLMQDYKLQHDEAQHLAS
ncbi:DAO-domain-containing protein, partial [Aureobasidium pullulans]